MAVRTYPIPPSTGNGQHPERRAPEPSLLAGRPTHAHDRERLRSWSYQSFVPREHLVDYRTRPANTVLATLRLIRDRDPDAAQAVTNFLLLMGQGYHAAATTDGDTPHTPAQDYIKAFDARIGEEYGGGMDAVIDVVNLTLVTQGAMAIELALNEDLDAVVDVFPVDPARITFKREPDTGRLMRGVLVARGTPGADADGFVELNPRQFRYVPFHPDVDTPYGRSPILAALTAIFFKVELLEDLKAVVHNQGYPRLDIAIVEEAVLNHAPAYLKADPSKQAELAAFVTRFLTDLQAQYAQLQPDDTFIHWDSVKVGYTGPPSGGAVSFEALERVLDTQIIAGLKMLPVLLGRNEGTTTTHATVQLRIFMLQIEALQRRTKRLIEWVHTTALQIAGFQARSKVTFDTKMLADQLLDAQTLETEGRAWGAAVDRGWVSDEDAAQAIFNHAPTGTARPQTPPDRERMPQTRMVQTRAPGGRRRRITSEDVPDLLEDPAIIERANAVLEQAWEAER